MAADPWGIRSRRSLDIRDVSEGFSVGATKASGVAGSAGVKAAVWFALATSTIVLVAGALLAALFSSADQRKAIAVSGVVAVVVQLVAFALARRMGERDFFTGWTAGAGVRFATLVVYGIIAVQVLGFPADAALVSLATFLFISTLVEHRFLTS